MMKSSTKGFTLIELLVVIAIIGILASIVLASLDTARKKGRDARRVSDLKQIQLALELYADSNNGNFPAVPSGGVAIDTNATMIAALVTAPNNYIAVIPKDPQSNSYTYGSVASDGTTACIAGNCAGFVLRSANMESTIPIGDWVGTAGGVSCVNASPDVNYCVHS